MQFFRNISKSKIVISATALFALVMVLTGLERSVFSPLRAPSRVLDTKVALKLNSFIQSHFSQFGTEPTDQQIAEYHGQAVKFLETQSRFSRYFKTQNFMVSTKQLMRFISANEHTKTLFDTIDRDNAADRDKLPAKLEEMKAHVEKSVFESSIASSAIATDDHIEGLRSVFMQERTYEWLKIDDAYIEPDSLSVDNEAEIQEYYQTHDFPSPSSATIQYMIVAPESVSHKNITAKHMQNRIRSGQSETPLSYRYKTRTYVLDVEDNNPIPDADQGKLSPLLSEIPHKYQQHASIHYKRYTDETLSASQAKKMSIDHAAEGSCIFSKASKKDSVICLNQIISEPCFSQVCVEQATKDFNAKQLSDAVNKKLAAIQNDKLFAPKDLEALSKKHKLTLQKSGTFTPMDSISESSKGDAIVKAVFSNGKSPALHVIRGPVKVNKDHFAFYQITDFNDETKKPLHDVRPQITKILHKQQMNHKLMSDCELSVKQLHNGVKISALAKKFKTNVLSSDQKLSASEQLPEAIMQRAQQIPSPRLGWTKPILHYHPDSNAWYLVALSNVVYTDKNTSSVDHIINDETVTRLIQRRELNAMHQTIMNE